MQLTKDFVNELNEVAESNPSIMQMKMIMKNISIIKQHNLKDAKVKTKHIFTKKKLELVKRYGDFYTDRAPIITCSKRI